jgi:hypothetical protein
MCVINDDIYDMNNELISDCNKLQQTYQSKYAINLPTMKAKYVIENLLKVRRLRKEEPNKFSGFRNNLDSFIEDFFLTKTKI